MSLKASARIVVDIDSTFTTIALLLKRNAGVDKQVTRQQRKP